MCNLYRMTKNKAVVAAWFGAVDELGGANFVEEVFPGYPGRAVAESQLRNMVWGFPLAQESKKTGEPLKLSRSTTLGPTSSMVSSGGSPSSSAAA